MQITAPDNRLYVVVGVIKRNNGEILIQQRNKGKDCEYQWEFPGGKLEDNETPEQALTRELDEELNICVTRCEPLMQLGFDYPHAKVWLDVFLVTDFDGEVSSAEGQVVEWLDIPTIRTRNLLKAVHPILDQLSQSS